MKVNISELKARLSAYLDGVRRGETVTVLDRKTPIAQIVPLGAADAGLDIEFATSPPSRLGQVRAVRPRKAVDVLKTLAESRGDH